MEPDVKTLLTQKIREAERAPVTWNKTAVWMKVQQRVSPPSKRPAYYYAAAGATFLLGGALFVWQMDSNLPVKKNVVESVSAEVPASQKQIATESNVKEKDHENRTVFVEPKPSEKVYGISEELPVALPTEEEEVTAIAEVTEEPLETHVAPEETILPIVGVIVEKEQKQVAGGKAKRRKLRTLESIEKTGTETANHLILARINK